MLSRTMQSTALFSCLFISLFGCGQANVSIAPTRLDTTSELAFDDNLPNRPAFERAAPIKNFHQVSSTIFRGSRPEEIGMQYLAHLGVRTVLNLEDYLSATPGMIREESELGEENGLSVVAMPLSPVFRLDRFYVERVLAVMGEFNRRPVFVHCRFGLERTGFIIALNRVYNEGWSPCRAYTEMRQFGYRPYLVPILTRHFWEWTRQFSAGEKCRYRPGEGGPPEDEGPPETIDPWELEEG